MPRQLRQLRAHPDLGVVVVITDETAECRMRFELLEALFTSSMHGNGPTEFFLQGVNPETQLPGRKGQLATQTPPCRGQLADICCAAGTG
jgi:hypothetical protein